MQLLEVNGKKTNGMVTRTPLKRKKTQNVTRARLPNETDRTRYPGCRARGTHDVLPSLHGPPEGGDTCLPGGSKTGKGTG